MLPAFTVIYLIVAFFVTQTLELTRVVQPPGWGWAPLVAAGYVILLVLWQLLKLALDPFLDGGLSETAARVDAAMQYGSLPKLERSYLILFGLCLAACMVLVIWDAWVWLTGGLGILVFLYCRLRKGRDPIPAPVLPTPLPPLEPAAPAEATVPRHFEWTFWTEPLVGRAEHVGATVQVWQSEYDERHAEPRLAEVKDWGAYVAQGRGPTLRSLCEELRKRSEEKRLSRLHEVALALSFAQGGIRYALDEETEGQPEYPKYPVETIYDGQGDCEDKSIIAAAALRQLGHDVLLFNLPHHIALGVAFEDLPGDYEEFDGRRYYCCEATTEGAWIGYRPRWWQARPEVIPIPASLSP